MMPSVPLKISLRAQNMKTGLDALGPPKTDLGAQSMKTGPGALGTIETESGSAKHEKRDSTPSVPLKMSLVAQNMKTDVRPFFARSSPLIGGDWMRKKDT
jgi:hypothetical protein